MRTRHVSAPINNKHSTRWLYQTATRFIVTTGERLKETLVRDNGFDASRIESVTTGIDTRRFVPGDKRQPPAGNWGCRNTARSSASSPPCAAGKATATC